MTESPPLFGFWLLLAVWLSLLLPLKSCPSSLILSHFPPTSSSTLQFPSIPPIPNILTFIMPAGTVLVAG